MTRSHIAGYAMVLALALGSAALTVHCRNNLAESGDLETIRILNEDYHWAFSQSPKRVDSDREDMIRSGKYMYPTLPLVYLPHMAIQLLMPAADSSAFVHDLSIFMTMFFLSLLYFVCLRLNVGPGPSALLTGAVLLNPFLFHLLISAPVLPSCALVPLGYLAYLHRRKYTAAAVFIVVAFSYRIGSVFLLLMLMSEPDERRGGDMAADWSFLLKTCIVLAALQILSQVLLVVFDPFMRALEGPRIEYAFSLLFWFMKDSTDNEAVFRLAEMAAWFAAGGAVLLIRRLTVWRVLLPTAMAGYLWFATGVLSQSTVIFLGLCGIAGAQLCRRDSSLRPPWAGRLKAMHVGTGMMVAAALVWLAAPVVRDPKIAEVGVQEEPEPRSLTTPMWFAASTATLEPDGHLTAAEELLAGLTRVERCLVDPYLLPFVRGRTCRTMVPLGKEPPAAALANSDRIIVDLSPEARQLRRLQLRDVRVSEDWARDYNTTLAALATGGKFRLTGETEEVLVLSTGDGRPLSFDLLAPARVPVRATP